MAQPPTPYIWKYQPQTGGTSGATQDTSAVINWLQSDGRMFQRIRDVNLARNSIDKTRALLTRDHIAEHINNWPSTEVSQRIGIPYIPANNTSIQSTLDFVHTAEGEQLAGAGITMPRFVSDVIGNANYSIPHTRRFVSEAITTKDPTKPSSLRGPPYRLNDGRMYRKLTRDAMPFPHNYSVYEDGQWKRIDSLSGGAANALSSYPTLLYQPLIAQRRPGQQLQGGMFPLDNVRNLTLLEEEARVPRNGGLNPQQFIREFPPVVYTNPFSGDEAYFPKEFSPLFDPARTLLRTTDQTLQYVSHP